MNNASPTSPALGKNSNAVPTTVSQVVLIRKALRVVSFVIGTYVATRQYSVSDHVATLIGYLGLATPNFLLALVLMYLANQWFDTSIGGIMDDEYRNQPWSPSSSNHYCREVFYRGVRELTELNLHHSHSIIVYLLLTQIQIRMYLFILPMHGINIISE